MKQQIVKTTTTFRSKAAGLALLAISALGLPAMSNPGTDTTFSIKGHLAGASTEQQIYLSYRTNTGYQQDSTIIRNGQFSFTGAVQKPTMGSLYVKGASEQFHGASIQIYLEPAAFTVTSFGSLNEAIVHGGATEGERQVWNQVSKSLTEKQNELRNRKYKSRENWDSVLVLNKAIEAGSRQWDSLEQAFISRFPDSYVSWDIVSGNSIAINPDALGRQMNTISERFRNSEEGKDIATRLEATRRTWIGTTAPEFTQPDVNGKKVKFSSYRGKYVLLEFWASWCGFCRLENPNLIKDYNKYKENGFTILGVSLDNQAQKEKWLAAIKEDKLTWTQVSDLKGSRENDVVKLYGIRGIPQNVLIDPNGIIIAKNLRGDALNEKLRELFGR
ncbi:MAG: TlpA disulfide reductase family protein [Candidatus Pseudobacter hemicellulosilyticus]|uniref:TlpA disulfide reductase family protein n=1 Tax=Candidatus Pseudobacter hemicellulosilyticus TaxID=3121375 RepID=A0AAJ6BJ86_9BACT|nr:MAG: TlpA disulfide reductase family protein [Pseudobacter sp.]